MKTCFKIFAAIVTAVSLTVTGCHKDTTATTNNTATPNTTTDTGSVTPFPVKEVIMVNYHYSPINTTAPAGSSVNWTNRDSVPHTATSSSGLFDSGDLSPGKNFMFGFQKAGTYDYFCRYHKETGKIVIQ
jgi:plastocyanin